MITVFGIRNCDTVKKALTWLDTQGVVYRFHDVRRDGLDAATLATWIARHGVEALINRRGTTWRRLPVQITANLDTARAQALMLAHPALIKRPLLELHDHTTVLGFDEAQYARLTWREML